MEPYILLIDMQKPDRRQTVTVKQGTSGSMRPIHLIVMDGSHEYDMSEITTATIHAVKPDKSVAVIDCDILKDDEGNNRNVIEYLMSSTIQGVAGEVVCECILTNNLSAVAASFDFYIVVENMLLNEQDLLSKDDLSGFRTYMTRAEKAAEDAEVVGNSFNVGYDMAVKMIQDLDNQKFGLESYANELKEKEEAGYFTGPRGPQGENGKDAIVTPFNFLFGFQIVGDELVAYYSGDEPPALSMNDNGELVYTLDDEKDAHSYGRVRGSYWFPGTVITGTDTEPKAYPTGIEKVYPGDYYVNLDDTKDDYDRGNVYQCVTGGDDKTATWKYIGSILGPEFNSRKYAAQALAHQENAAKSEEAAAASAKAAADSEAAALNHQENAAKSEETVEASAKAAAASEQNAKASEQASNLSENRAKESEQNAASSEEEAEKQKTGADESAKQAKISETNASDSESKAKTSEGNAETYSKKASEAAASAQKSMQEAKNAAASLSGALKPKGTCMFSELPDNPETGDMYNISDGFTSDDRFNAPDEPVAAGSNIYYTDDGKWDVIAGTQVTGVKGDAEATYRTGNVNITAADIGLGNLSNISDSEKNVKHAATAGNADTVNNHTVNSDVPVGAKFTDTTYAEASESASGLLSASDKAKLNGIDTGAQKNSVTGVKGDAEATYRTGNVNITAGNVGAYSRTEIDTKLKGYVGTSDSRLTNARPASDVSAWAKAAQKPSYSASEVGALASNGKAVDASKADYSGKVKGTYTGNGGQQNPAYFGKGYAGFLMMNTSVNGDTHYKNWLLMDNYSGSDIGGASAIGVDRSEARAFIMQSDAQRSSWNNTAEIYTTANMAEATDTEVQTAIKGLF